MKLRKSISLILAMCMIISLLPAVSFSASAAGVKKISTEYNFTRAAFNNVQFTDELGAASWSAKCVTDSSMLNRELSTGKWIYRGGTKTYNNPPSTSTYVGYFNHATIDVLNTGFSIYSSAAGSGLNTTVLEIEVDKDDYYKPTFNYYKYNKNGVLNVYLVDKAEFDGRSGWDITNYSYAVNQIIKPMINNTTPYVTVTKLGSVDTYDEAAVSNTTTTGSYTNENAIYIKKGTYYLFINMTEGECGANTRYLHIESIELLREEPLPPLTDIEVPDQEIFVGEKLDVEDQIVWKSNGSLLEGTGDVTYEVRDNASGALLEGKDGNIYGRAQGNATLRVTGEMDGDIAYKDITVTVREDNSYSGAEQKMFFFLSGYADTSTALTFVADEMNAENFAESFHFSEYGDVRPWAMVSANVTRRNSKGAFFPHDSQYLDLSINDAGEWVAFKVKVPAPGKYAVDIGCYCYKNGGLAKIYMLPYDEEVMTFQNIADNIDTYASEETFAAEADTYIAEDANSGPRMQSMMGTFVADESLDYSKGYTDYLMIIKSDYSRINPARSYIYLHTINFVGSGNIAEAEIDITDSGIGIGETMEICGVSAKNAVGGAFDLSGAYIEHSVKDGSEDILELTEDGKTFRAKENGTAVIETLILLDGCAYVKETEITVAPELMSRAAYLYSVGNAVVGKAVELTSRIEQENRKVLSVGRIESIEIISEEPAGEVVTLLPDGKTLEAIGAGSVTVRGVVNARGKRYTTEEITVVVSPITTPYPASFSISFPRVSYSDNVEFLSHYERYTAERNWVFNKIVNYSSGYDRIKLSAYDHAAIVWKKNVEPRYIAFKTFFSAPGKYEVSLAGVSRYRAANAEVYAVPFSRENESKLESLMQTGNEYYLGHIDMYDPDESSAGIKNTVTAEGATGEIASAGEYLVVLKLAPGKSAAAGRDDDCLYIKHIHFKNKSAFSAVELKAENDVTQLEAGNKLALTPKLYSGDGSVIEYEPEDVSIVYTSDNREIATVDENGTVTAVNEGKANITASVTLGKVTISGSIEISVSDSSGVDTDLGITATVSPDTVFAYASTQIKLHVAMNSGRWVEIPYEYITWNVVSGEDFATVADDGTVTGRLVGDIVIQPVVDENYKENISGIEIAPVTVHVVWDSTLTPSIYTIDERTNAIENAKKYSWAKSAAKTAMSRADKYADKIDFLYNMVVPEGLPRSYHIGHKYDPRRLFCRYCGEDIGSEYGAYGFVADPMSREWKVQCPDCKRIFPSNDFGKFYQLGLSEDKNHWSYSDALQKHHEKFVCEDAKNGKPCSHSAPADSAPDEGSEEWMQKDPRDDAWYEYYGYGVAGGYLTNDMYEDMDARWAVDDGLGYRQPYVSDPDAIGYDSRYFEKNGYAYYTDGGNTGPVYYSYIAYYLHEGVWYGNGVSPGVVKTALSSLINAFVYTGDEKYGRAGAILLDRVGDVYPDMYWYRWAPFRGDGYRGDVCDVIWSAYMGKMFAKSADAFLPIYNDPYVASYLAGRGETYEADESGNYIRNEDGSLKPVNLKNSPGALRKHVEDNILLTVYDHMKRGMQSSNFGSHQSTLAAAAVALNKMPETKEMLDWMMQTGEEFSTGPEREETEKGLNVMKTLIQDVTRDGMGNENSTHYNAGWLTNMIDLADTLGGYDGYKEIDLFANPKFTKMFTSHLRVTLGNYYCAQIGDAASTASTGIKISHNNIDDALVGFKYTKDRMLARAMYLLNGNTAEGLHYTILDKNPESLEDEVRGIVEEDGEFFLGSDMMTGFGFAALRAGGVHNSVNAQTASNTSRDFGIYFGASGGHGHLDSLNLFIDAFGLNLAPDLGYPAATGWDPNRYEWVRTTISHNTVVVDEKEQTVKAVSGTPYHFDDNGKVRIMDVSSNAYENTDDYRRTVFMVDVNDDISYGVDFFHVKGGRDHLYSFHSQSDDLTVIKGLSDMQETPTYADPDGNLYGTYAGEDVLYGADPGGVFNGQYPRGY
ncbi:MAG: heparinase II/III family protein, partial [Oscillospiraceae bacterium]|nr:heparinase II/III family protein [Oscillospiraceae bacterium]